MMAKISQEFNLDKKEINFIWFCSLILIAATSFWLIYGWLSTPAGFYFLGLNSLSPGDTYVYFSYLEQIKQGNLFLKDLYTSESQNYYLNIFWLPSGLMAKIFNLSNLLAYQLVRIFLLIVFLFLLYLFISYFFQEKRKRKICFIFLISSSGLGFLLSPFLYHFYYLTKGYANWPIDLWVAEANTFLTLYQSPLKIASLGLIVLIFFSFLLAIEKNKVKYSLVTGFSGLLLFHFHPFHIVTCYFILAAFSFYLFLANKVNKKDLIKHLLIFIVLSLPSVIYYWLLVNFDPNIKIKYQQNLCLSPSWLMTIVGYGLLIPLAIAGILNFLKIEFWQEEKKVFLLIWLISQTILIYLPFKFQRRLSEGLHIIIVIMAIYGLFYIYQKLYQIYGLKIKTLIKNFLLVFVFLYFIFFMSSNLSIVISDFFLYRSREPILYLNQGEVKALYWLRDNSKIDEIILTHQLRGNFIPGLIGRTVYAGHDVETLFYDQKIREIKWFFEDDSEGNKKADFLRVNRLFYIFYGELEKKLGSLNPQNKNFLKLIYKNPEVKIYQVVY